MPRGILVSAAVALALSAVAACDDPTHVEDADSALLAASGPVASRGGGKPSPDIPLRVSISDADVIPANQLRGDGQGDYVDGECSVSAAIKNTGDPEAAYFRFDPLTERNPRKLKCTARAYFLDLEPSTRVHLGDDPHEDTTLGELGLLTEPRADEAGVAFLYEFYDLGVGTEPRRTRGNFAVPFCRGADGRGAPMRFNPDMNPGSDRVEVTQPVSGVWRVRTQPAPNNKAWCEHHLADGSTVELLLHVDLAYAFSALE